MNANMGAAAMLPADLGTHSPLDQIIDLVIGAAGGFVAAIVTFRTRLALADQRERARARARDEERRAISKRFDELDRRQLIVLQVIADIAKHLKLDKRFSDALVRFLADDVASSDRPRRRGLELPNEHDDNGETGE